MIELIADNGFKNGFICGGAYPELGIVGELKSPATDGSEPSWLISQWACKNDISMGLYTYSDDGYCYVNASQRVEVSWRPNTPLVTVELKASEEYEAPRKAREIWYHLLVEQQGIDQRCPTLDKVSALNLEFDSRIAYCKTMMEHPDPSIHAAQVSLFFTVVSKSTNDMYWFGVPVFDVRDRFVPEYGAEDNGMDVASHKYIYIVAQKEFTNISAHEYKLLQYRTDLLPYIKHGMSEAVSKGYLSTGDLANYTLTSMNLGYEMPGTYDSAYEIYRLSLKAITIE